MDNTMMNFDYTGDESASSALALSALVTTSLAISTGADGINEQHGTSLPYTIHDMRHHT